jgi:hypothetical protein
MATFLCQRYPGPHIVARPQPQNPDPMGDPAAWPEQINNRHARADGFLEWYVSELSPYLASG